jgi:hypothetical protein
VSDHYWETHVISPNDRSVLWNISSVSRTPPIQHLNAHALIVFDFDLKIIPSQGETLVFKDEKVRRCQLAKSGSHLFPFTILSQQSLHNGKGWHRGRSS